jgi:hypothetical protein
MRGTSDTVIAMITFCRLARINAINAIATRMAGMAIIPSTMRMMMPSSRRLYPLTRPIETPNTVVRSETLRATASEIRPPWRVRA